MTSDPAERIRLDGQVFIVTGAGGGIGTGICDSLVAAGASVVAQVRDRGVDESEAVSAVSVDLRDADAPGRIVDHARARFGRIDGLINNAGVQPTVPFADLDDADWAEMIDVTVVAADRLTRAVAGVVGSSGASVVHIASIEARHPTTEHGHYATAKAALVMHAKAAALALGPQGIRVNVVLPGLIARPGLAAEWPDGVQRWMRRAPLGRLGTPGDIGDACVFLCSPMAAWITGAELVVDGGMLTNPTW